MHTAPREARHAIAGRARAAKSGVRRAICSGVSTLTITWRGPLTYRSTGSTALAMPTAPRMAAASGTGSTFGVGCVMRPKMMRGPSRCKTTGTGPIPVSSTIVSTCSGPPSTKAAPSTGCPANGSSLPGVKIRIRACPPASARNTNTVSEKLISFASNGSIASGIARASVNTAS
jgi:hypothetical protein